jgi:hypothetical protein
VAKPGRGHWILLTASKRAVFGEFDDEKLALVGICGSTAATLWDLGDVYVARSLQVAKSHARFAAGRPLRACSMA